MEKISFSLKLFFDHFYGQSFIKTVRGPLTIFSMSGMIIVALLDFHGNLSLFAYWVIFHAFWSSADFFSKLTFLKNLYRNIIQVSNSLDLDQVRHFVWPDLVTNCLQRILAVGTRRKRV